MLREIVYFKIKTDTSILLIFIDYDTFNLLYKATVLIIYKQWGIKAMY